MAVRRRPARVAASLLVDGRPPSVLRDATRAPTDDVFFAFPLLLRQEWDDWSLSSSFASASSNNASTAASALLPSRGGVARAGSHRSAASALDRLASSSSSSSASGGRGTRAKTAPGDDLSDAIDGVVAGASDAFTGLGRTVMFLGNALDKTLGTAIESTAAAMKKGIENADAALAASKGQPGASPRRGGGGGSGARGARRGFGYEPDAFDVENVTPPRKSRGSRLGGGGGGASPSGGGLRVYRSPLRRVDGNRVRGKPSPARRGGGGGAKKTKPADDDDDWGWGSASPTASPGSSKDKESRARDEDAAEFERFASVARGWRAERDAALAANAALRKELDGLRQEHASLKRQNLSLNKRLLANAHCGEGGDPLHEQMRRQTESLLGEKSALARECDALKRECVSLQARSISHWFPYDRVGVVNAVP